MDFNSPASLVFYSSVKIAATLFCRQDLFYLEQKQLHLVGWVQVQDSVAQLVQSLQLPKNIEENVQELIQPIGDQIRRWLSKRSFVSRGKVDLYNKFSWTSHGMIDYRKTAENLIESKQLDLCIEFTLAHLDAVDDYALYVYQDPLKLAQVVLEDNSIPVRGTDSKAKYECCLMMKHLIIKRFEEDPTLLNSPSALEPNFYESAVNTTASNGNTALTRYFIAKIEPHIKASLVRNQVLKILKTNNRFVNLDTLLFLLSQMDTRQISELFIENTEHVLLRFLEWPLQRHFMKLASKLWNAMSPATFISVLQAIVQHIIQHCSVSINPFGYKDIFRDFWLSSPAEYRRICVNELIIPIMSNLFCSHGYFSTVLHLFGNESYHEKLEMLFFSNADAVLEILSNENKAKAFESIVQRYFSPDDIPFDFGEKYNIFTQKYLECYYGEIDIAD
ncbi:uncharacterized protein LOC129957427 isoform X2 [Argiope bruennichi]|uniref:Uncharacterized protein n=2 Tax=Argiope bruennichi TaxID=94029 RepID=A0A8T0FKG1_ARGBR|nr:uncharacterized protein LOC129957427 isoform X2 [Argiope bruennichi]XP_055925717.1 uncharacterized protein LOC129957427 isoform X2 [Argiope bruennichi]KAF8789850.1 hypothetical protein HNY73_007759 [Argiope bruennichi]